MELSKATGKPVKVIWKREEDIQYDAYRPGNSHRISGALDEQRPLIAWSHKVAAPSMIAPLPPQAPPVDGPTVRGITDLQYESPNVSVEYVRVKTPIPVHFWRSVGDSHNGFPVESFMDEMAHPSGREPLEFRMQHLKHNPRAYRTLEVVAQVEGALTMGLSSASKEKLESSEGGFQSSNFSAYQLPPMSKAPDVEVPILESDGSIWGMGETGLPPVAPVVANAVFAATGTRIRRRPMTPSTFLEARGRGD